MGLLDDAIREHLELKRRHGADPGEVARLEREAFGPLRRGAGDAPAVAQEVRPVAPLEPEYEYEDDDLEYEADVLYEDASATGPEPHVEALHEPPAQPPVEPAHEPPVEPAPAPPPAPPEAGQQATAEFSVEDEREADEAEEEGDELLEETPEFLQETPEHDRLWFEQRPPRDFDF